MEEPSVLDYLKSRLTPWRGKKIVIPPAEAPIGPSTPAEVGVSLSTAEALPSGNEPIEYASITPAITTAPAAITIAILPWRTLLAVGLALLAQISLEPGPERVWQAGAILYLLAAACMVWAYVRSEWVAVSHGPEARPWGHQPWPHGQAVGQSAVNILSTPFISRPLSFIISIGLGALAFLTFGGNRFTSLNVTLWVMALIALVWAFWQLGEASASWIKRLPGWLSHQEWHLTINRWGLLLIVAITLSVFYRVYRIEQVPPEMVSDHAEKLLDVWDVVHGGTSIFFPRNTGREGLQMYLTAGIINLLGTGFTYLSLKIGTVLAGLLTLPFIYLLGKEMGSRRVGLYAMLFAGIAYWPNVISRVGLRFPLYPLFVAPTLYYLMRGLRTSHLNDFLLAGLALGIGLHGYTPIRILPFIVVVAVLLYLLHRQPAGSKPQALRGLALLALVALFVFLPLLRYALENPDMFSYRSLSRLGTVEQPLPGPAGQIFLSNLWRAMTMFAWDDGEIWVHSVMQRPALDVVSAALFYLGAALLLVRYLRQRDWRDLFWLLAVPLLMLPSILSLAFPAENPALNRMAGAIVPVYLIVGFCLDGLLETLHGQIGGKLGSILAGGVGLFLFLWASVQNYDLVFNQYQDYYRRASWNTSEMGVVIRDFAGSVGSPDTAWVLAFPHWVDTRLVGINAGFPTRDYAIWPDGLQDTLADPRPKLFLVKPEDSAGIGALHQLYPAGILQVYTSQVEDHDFWMYFVPPDQ